VIKEAHSNLSHRSKLKVTALLQGKCPRCRKGNVFTHHVSKILSFQKMNKSCPVCGVLLEPEPGFYQGAMYVSYAFTVAVIVAVGILLFVLGDPPSWVYILTVIAVMILLIPFNYRYSRMVYLYLFGGIRFDERFAE